MRSKRKSILINGLIAAGVVVVFAFVCWKAGVQYQFYPKRFGTVVEGKIYRSAEISSRLLPGILKKYNIKVIITFTDIEKSETTTTQNLGIELLPFPLRGDGTGDPNTYIKAIAAINSACLDNKPVLVHCSAGANRTGGVIAVYRLLIEKEDASKVVKEMESYGWNGKGNKNLIPFLNSNMKTIAVMLQEMGVIKQIPEPIPQLKI